MLLEFGQSNLIKLNEDDFGERQYKNSLDIFENLQTSLYSKNTAVSLMSLGVINNIL
jgi:hypothetical protein